MSVGAGVFLFLCYEFLSVLRNVITHSRTVRAVVDVFYWTAAGFLVFGMIYRFNQGIMRSFLFIGSILGAWICSVTVGPIFCRYTENVCGIPVHFVKKHINRLLFLFKSCSILVYKRQALWKKKIFKRKRISQIEKIKKKKSPKKNSE